MSGFGDRFFCGLVGRTFYDLDRADRCPYCGVELISDPVRLAVLRELGASRPSHTFEQQDLCWDLVPVPGGRGPYNGHDHCVLPVGHGGVHQTRFG